MTESTNPLAPEKVFIMHGPLVAQNCNKHFPFLLVSESPSPKFS